MIPSSARAVLLALSLLSAATAAAQLPEFSEGGYAGRHSVVAGGSITFHIATSVTPFAVEIFNMTAPGAVLQTIGGLTSSPNDCSGKWENGCLWPVTTTFAVPVVWTPGFYAARFPTSRGTRHIFFVVRATSPGAYARIALLQNSNTDVAYNDWGGKSVYDTRSTDGERAAIVSFDRPYKDDAGFSRIREWELPIVLWMQRAGIAFEVFSDDDMEAGIPLDAYEMLILAGHSEYWSLKARTHLEDYIANGGNLAIFGGNTMWWQVRVDLATRQMTVYKDPLLDPMTGIDDDLVTTNFYAWPVFNRENTILGASFLNAGYVNKDPDSSWERLPLDERTPYTVTDAGHWVFEGTGLADGAAFGRWAGAIEVDGAIFNTMPDGSVVVEGSDGTPLNTELLATLPASYGYGTIGIFTTPAGGAVFNGAARDWPIALANDPVIERITRNVIDRFSDGVPFEFVPPRVTPNRAEDRFNTQVPTLDVLPGWEYDRLALTPTAGCATEGAAGLQLAGTRWTQLVRTFAGGAGISEAAANLRLNADLLESSATFATPLLEFVDRQGTSVSYVAALEIMDFADGRYLRATAIRGTSPSVSTQWVLLPPGWHPVTISWASPGAIELNVSGTKAIAFNSDSGQSVNTVMLEWAGRWMTGTVCVDHLQVRDAFLPASGGMSTMSVTSAVVPADGTTTATIEVLLFDAEGHPLVNGGDVVTLETTRGTISPVVDNGDGTYGATITSASGGIATIRAAVNGEVFSEEVTVTFEGEAASLVASAPASVMTGEPFEITVEARDGGGGAATGYRGTVRFTTTGTDATLPSEYTFTAEDGGVHAFAGLSFDAPGARTITVRDAEDAALSVLLNIDVMAATSTMLASNVNPSYSGQSVTFTATVESEWDGSFGGTVIFSDGGEPIGSAVLEGGVATFTTTALTEGTHPITAAYSGEGHVLSSDSPVISQTVGSPQFHAPGNFTATALSSQVVRTRWQLVEAAVRYDVFRRAAGGGYVLAGSTTGTTLDDIGVPPDSAFLYYVQAVSASGAVAASASDVASTVIFRNDPLKSGETVIRATHIIELRSAINAFRALTGLPAATFTDQSLAGKRMKVLHVTDLRVALKEARGSAALPLTDPTLESGDPMKAVHLQELRDALK